MVQSTLPKAAGGLCGVAPMHFQGRLQTALEKRPLSKGRMPSATAAFKSATRARRPKMLPATAETAVAGLAIRAL